MANPQRDWMLALEAFRKGDLAAASFHCQSVLRAHPGHPPAHQLLAEITMQSGRPRSSANHALAAARQYPRLGAPEKLRLTWSLIVCGESGAAQELLKSAATRTGMAAGETWEMARQLAILGLHGAALDCIGELDRSGVAAPQVSHMRGNLQSFMGRAEEAAVSFEEAIAQAPRFALAHWSLARLGLGEGREDRARRMARLLEAGNLSPDDQAMLGYGIFHELDGLQAENAWAALMRGASARRSITRFEPQAETQLFDAIIANTSSREAVPQEPEGPTPIFIVGMPRTGTTLLERILGNHSGVQVCGELTDFVQQHQWVRDRTWEGMLDVASSQRLPEEAAHRLGVRYLRSAAWRIERGKRYFTDKNPGNFMAIGHILAALPDARIIHLRRQPMDACFSNLKVLFAPLAYPYSYTLEELAHHHRNYSRLMRHWDAVYPGRILTVDYESLVRASRTEAERILAFCQLEHEAGIEDVTANPGHVSTASRTQVREPVHQKNIDAWRRYESQLMPLLGLLEGGERQPAGA